MKTARQKFKIGDRVERIKGSQRGIVTGFIKGDVYQVKITSDRSNFYLMWNASMWKKIADPRVDAAPLLTADVIAAIAQFSPPAALQVPADQESYSAGSAVKKFLHKAATSIDDAFKRVRVWSRGGVR